VQQLSAFEVCYTPAVVHSLVPVDPQAWHLPHVAVCAARMRPPLSVQLVWPSLHHPLHLIRHRFQSRMRVHSFRFTSILIDLVSLAHVSTQYSSEMPCPVLPQEHTSSLSEQGTDHPDVIPEAYLSWRSMA
jgi:hypothetical protein